MASSRDHTDNRFEALAASAPDAILTIDQDSVILSANPAVQRLFGYAPEELVGQSLSKVIPERLRARHFAGVGHYLRTGVRNVPWTGIELAALHRDGHEVPVEISFGEFTEPGGRRVFSGFVRDVSERVRQQRELQEARAAAEQALGELGRLGRITDVAIAQSTYEDMVQQLLRHLRDELKVDEAAVLFLNAEKTELTIGAWLGLAPDMSARTKVPVGAGVAGRAVAANKPIVVADIGANDAVSPVVRRDLSSLAAVPLRTDGHPMGALHVGSRKRRSFSDGDVRLLEIVADRMAGVLARLQLFEAERRARLEEAAARRELAARERELKQANSELEKRARDERALRALTQSIAGAQHVRDVMQRIAEGAITISGAIGSYVEQVRARHDQVEIVAVTGERTPPLGQRVPFPGSLTEEIIERREPAFLARLEGVGAAMAPYLARYCLECSVLIVPLFAEREPLGTLALLRPENEPPFDPVAINRLRTLADLASIALQRLVALDESERRRLEAEAAVRSRDEVLSIVSHDLRNPVSTVMMSAGLLADPEFALSDADRRKQIDVIGRSAHRMNRLIQDLLDVARIEGQRLTIDCRCEDPAALAVETCEAFRPIAADKSIDLACDIDHDLPRVSADRDRVAQVLSNYLNNALKFTPSGGSVVLRATLASDGGVRLSVSDTGPGISAEDLPHVFDRFWQAKRTAHLGSGLGLAIAKGIAEAHHGRVGVESTPGKGSTFWFVLPRGADCGGAGTT